MMSWDGMNRRKGPRVLYPCLVIVRAGAGQQDAILAHTENIAYGGLGLILKKEIHTFTPVDIEVDLLDLGEHIKCQGRVVWCVRRKSQESTKPLFYDVGIEFGELKEPDQKRIENIIQRLAKPIRV